MNIDTPQSSIAPQPPRDPMEKPSEPIRKPGLARATTNPSHHRSDLRSSRSSMATVATDKASLVSKHRSERATSDARGPLAPGEFLYRLQRKCRLRSVLDRSQDRVLSQKHATSRRHP